MTQMSAARAKPRIDSTADQAAAYTAARQGCDKLLAAQLRTGQHLLAFDLAVKLGDTLGLPASAVRPAADDQSLSAAKYRAMHFIAARPSTLTQAGA